MSKAKDSPSESVETGETLKTLEEHNQALVADNSEMAERIAQLEAKLSAEVGRSRQLQRDVRSLKKTLEAKASTHGSIAQLPGIS